MGMGTLVLCPGVDLFALRYKSTELNYRVERCYSDLMRQPLFRCGALKGVVQLVLSNSFASIHRIGLNHGALLGTRKTW